MVNEEVSLERSKGEVPLDGPNLWWLCWVLLLAEMSLGVEVQRCAARAQKKSSTKRKASLAALTLPDGRPLMFGKESRKKIPEEVIQEIRWVLGAGSRSWMEECGHLPTSTAYVLVLWGPCL